MSVGRSSATPDSHAAEALAARPFHQFLVHHRAPDLIGDADRGAQRRLGERDGEFLAAVARGDVLTPDDLLHRNGNEAQDLIAGEMSEPIVESLEVIDVAHQQSERLVAGLGFCDRAVKLGIEELPVGERRQRIGQTLGPNGLEILLQLLDLFARSG